MSVRGRPSSVEIRLKIEVTAGGKQRMMSSLSSRTVAIWVLSNRLRKSSWRGLKPTWQEIRRLNGARRSAETVPRTWDPDSKGRLALAQMIRVVSSKEAGRTLGVSPRSADLHRANLLKKLGQERRRSSAQGPRRIAFLFDSRQCVHHPARA